MSADLRLLLRALADEAPPLPDRLALADRSYAAGRRRRRIRHLELTGGTAIVLVLTVFAALFAGSSPLAAQYGTSSATHVSGYPSHIGRQLPVLDLPAKPGPIAGLLSNGDEWWAVSPNGHRWTVPGATTNGVLPALSGDGRFIGYGNSRGGYTIHDLVGGKVTQISTIDTRQDDRQTLEQVWLQVRGVFSADDRYVAMSASSGATVVIDVRSGAISSTARVGEQWFAGWVGDSVVTASATDAELRSAVGDSVRKLGLRVSPSLPDTDQSSYAVSRDGTLTLLSGGDAELQQVSRVDLSTGAQVGSRQRVPSAVTLCSFSVGRDVYYNHTDPATQALSVVAVDNAGETSTRTTIDGALKASCGIWATDAFDGAARTPQRLDRFGGWLMSDWPWIAWPLGVLGSLVFVSWRVRVYGRQYALDFPDRVSARRPLPRRTKVALVASLLATLSLGFGLLIPYVLLPLHAGDLAPVQPAIWWTAADQSAARPGSSQGDPARQVPLRLGEQQGLLVLVINPTGRDQKVLSSDPGEFSLAVSTTSGSVAQARSLVYRPSGTVPAHQSRWVRLLIRSDECWEKGGGVPLPGVTLPVRIGWLTRNEVIPLIPQMEFVAKTTYAPPGANC